MDDNTNDRIIRAPRSNWTVQGYVVRYPRRRFTPPADIIELEEGMVVLVEIAGVRGEDIKIAISNDILSITGNRERPSLSHAAYHQVEIGFGEFRLDVRLPWSVDPDAVRATYRNGFLRVDLPRPEARQVHVVDVNTEESD